MVNLFTAWESSEWQRRRWIWSMKLNWVPNRWNICVQRCKHVPITWSLDFSSALSWLRLFGTFVFCLNRMNYINLSFLFLHITRFVGNSFNVKPRDLPEVCSDFKRFLEVISDLNDQTPMVWNPITKKMSKWIDMRQLDRAYSNGGHGAKCASCLLS